MRVLLVISFLLFSVSISVAQENPAQTAEKEFISLHPDLNLPFADAVKVGNIVYVSGQIGYDSGTNKLVEGGIEAETEKVLTNIKNILEKLGASMDDIVKCTVILADIKEWQAMNRVYKTFFTKYPARTAIAANGLGLDARVEIDCIAVINK